MHDLDKAIGRIQGYFEQHDRYEAHRKSQEVLKEMEAKPDILHEIIRRNLKDRALLTQLRINPVIALHIFENKDFSFIAHCWMPLPDRSTNTTHQSIHHHGNLLLSSINAFGPGYSSYLFKSGFKADSATSVTQMEVHKVYNNAPKNLEFVETDTPHVVFYPSDFSITYALWSNDKVVVADGLKQLKFLRRYKHGIKKVISGLGLAKSFNINPVENMDFYPHDGKVIAMKDRVRYPEGSNENFIQNCFYLFQKVGFKDEGVILEAINQLEGAAKKQALQWFESFKKEEAIADVFEDIHLNIPKVNFSRAELEACFPNH